jgi:hypothetical protein
MSNEHHKWEQAAIQLLNLDGWQLEWTGEEYEHFDAKGKTPKGYNCLMEIKTRNKYYNTKVIEKYKYNKLMAQNNCMKFYYVFDEKGNYLFHLDNLKLELSILECPSTTTFENKEKRTKEVYLLTESQASIINRY